MGFHAQQAIKVLRSFCCTKQGLRLWSQSGDLWCEAYFTILALAHRQHFSRTCSCLC